MTMYLPRYAHTETGPSRVDTCLPRVSPSSEPTSVAGACAQYGAGGPAEALPPLPELLAAAPACALDAGLPAPPGSGAAPDETEQAASVLTATPASTAVAIWRIPTTGPFLSRCSVRPVPVPPQVRSAGRSGRPDRMKGKPRAPESRQRAAGAHWS